MKTIKKLINLNRTTVNTKNDRTIHKFKQKMIKDYIPITNQLSISEFFLS